MSLPLPSSLSPSKVSAFKDCGLAFRFSAIDKLPEPPSAPAVKGTLVHRALQMLFWLPAPQRTIGAAVELLGVARAEMALDPEYTALGLTDEQEEEFAASALELVHRYFQLEDPTTVRVIGTEIMLDATIDSMRLRGIIDRLELDAEGNLVVVDYKSGRSPGLTFEQSRLGGVHFYAYLCQQNFGVRPAKVRLLYLSDPVAIETTPTEQSVRFLERQTTAIWKAVVQACEREDFRPKPGRLCDWCSYQAYCPAFGGDPSLARTAATAEVPLPMPPVAAGV